MMQNVLKLFVVCFLGITSLQAQSVRGTVTDAIDGTPLPGVNVIVKGTANGVSTDFDGNYTIELQNSNSVLQFSYMGYTSREINVNGKTVINVTLEQSAESLNEVVVTALGIKKETKALGYSITEVKGDEMSLIKETNAINSLQGKVAGVNITGNSTGAAGSSRVIIRGNTSLTGNNQPLYIIDGIPMGNDNQGSAGMWGGSDGGDGVSSINPDDVASVSVLKGGAAAALYGSRASNGVIIITTKKGKQEDGFGIEFSSSMTVDQVNPNIQDFQRVYGQGINGEKPSTKEIAFDNPNSSWGAKLDGSSVVNWDGVSRPYSYAGNNIENFYRTGTTFINTLAISGATDKSNYRFSASNLSNDDIVPNSSLDRKSFSLNLGTVLADKISFNTSVKYIREGANNRPRLSDSPGNANYSVAVLPANVGVETMKPGMNEDGTELGTSNNIYATNPYWASNNFRNDDQKNRIIASASARYDVLDWLYLFGRVGIDDYTRKSTAVEPWGTAYKMEGGMSEEERRYTQVDSDIMIGVEKQLSEKFATNSFIGLSANTTTNESLSLNGQKFIVPGLETIKNTKDQSYGFGYNKRKMNSVYGSLEVSYSKIAYLTFTARNDWFSTLSAPGKTTPNDDLYTSVNTSVILSEAFEMPEWVNFLKFRGGYSELAGGAQDPYQLGLSYGIFGQGHQGNPLGEISNGSIPNPDLIPFNVSEVEVGFDARFLENRLSFDVSYYDKSTTNDIVAVSASEASGYGSSIANLGEISNKGLELLISGTPVTNENFTWKSSINFSHNKSEVVATNATNSDIGLGDARSQNVGARHIVGQPYGVIYGTSYERNDAGRIMYEIGDDGIPRAKVGDRKQLGEGVAPYTVGFNNSFRYKSFNMAFLIDAKFGGQIFSGTNAGAVSRGQHKMTLEGRENGLSVTGINADTGSEFTATVAPEDLDTYWGRISGIAEEFVEDADYIKFRQVSFGYNLPESLLQNTFITSCNVSVIGKNLFYFSKSIDNIDPESAYQTGNGQGLEYYGLPTTRSYGVSLNVKF